MGAADFGPDDFVVGIEDEGGGVGGFFGSVPAEAVSVGEGVFGVEEQVEAGGERFVGDELGAFVAGPGIDEVDVLAFELRGFADEFFDLTIAQWALVAGEATEEDQDQRTMVGGERNGFTGEIGEREIRGFVAFLRRCGGEESQQEQRFHAVLLAWDWTEVTLPE